MVFPQFGFTDDDVHNDVVRYVVMDNKDAYPFNQYHSHEYSELMFFINGGGKHNINFKEYEIQSGSVHVLAAGDVHWLERSPESTGFVIVYKDAFLYKLMENTKAVDYFGLLNDSKVFSLGAGYGQLRLLMMEIQQQQHDPLYLYNLLGALFTKLAQLYHSATTQYGFATKPTAPQTSILQSFINLLEKEYLNRLLLEDYAKKLNLTPVTLNRKVKALTGKSVTALQQEYLLKEAKSLLASKRIPAKNIADRLGFFDSAQFSHWFKKRSGLTPRAFARLC